MVIPWLYTTYALVESSFTTLYSSAFNLAVCAIGDPYPYRHIFCIYAILPMYLSVSASYMSVFMCNVTGLVDNTNRPTV